jgi:hypothetical protein
VPLQLEEVDCSSVHEAVRKDHHGCLKLLLANEPASALQLDEHGETPLQCVEHTLPRCQALTTALLSAQPPAAVAAVINAVDRQQRTALQRVVRMTRNEDSWPEQRVCQRCLRALCAAGADARIADVPAANSYGNERYSMTGSTLAEAVLRTGTAERSGSDSEQQRRRAAAAVARISASLRALQQGGLDVNSDACYLHMCTVAGLADSAAALLACGADVHKGACSQLVLQLSLARAASVATDMMNV